MTTRVILTHSRPFLTNAKVTKWKQNKNKMVPTIHTFLGKTFKKRFKIE